MVKGGGTQVDFTQDNSYFLAPSFTYRPDFDTRFTVIALASKDRTNGNNLLPYEGSVVNAPFGKSRPSCSTSEPGQDYFMRGQTMIGYQFEKDFSNGLTFRQNARYAHVETNINSYIGNGYARPSSIATLARYHFLTNGKADLGTIDNQLEGRFNTGAVSHKFVFGVDYRKYRLDDYQATNFGAGGNAVTACCIFSPVYGSADRPAPLPQSPPRPGSTRCLRAGSDEARSLHAGPERSPRLGRHLASRPPGRAGPFPRHRQGHRSRRPDL